MESLLPGKDKPLAQKLEKSYLPVSHYTYKQIASFIIPSTIDRQGRKD